VRRTLSLLVWFALLEALWALFVGTRQGTELVAGLIAAAAGALLAELLRSHGLLAFTPDPRLLARAAQVPYAVVFDFCLVTRVLMRALARGQRVRGQWVRAPFPTASGSAGRWQRVFGVVAGTAAPNAIVVEVRDDEAWLHSLEPRVWTGKSVL